MASWHDHDDFEDGTQVAAMWESQADQADRDRKAMKEALVNVDPGDETDVCACGRTLHNDRPCRCRGTDR